MNETSPGWLQEAVFYQIFPDRFARSARVGKPAALEPWDAPPTLHGFKGGDLLGLAERLDYLEELGVNALYLNPVFASTANHRYHTHDYFKVDPLLGGDEALRQLLDQARARGMRVILDGVFNHASRGFFQFNHTLENGRHSPYVDWFHFNRRWLDEGRPINAYAAEPTRYHPPGTETSLDLHGYRAWWDIPSLPKFNTANPEVRAYLFQVAEHWMRFGIDGWRLDVPSEIDDDDFWREFRARVKAINPEAYIVGEIWHDARRWLAGDQFDGVTNYLLGRAILGFCMGDSLNRAELDRCGLKEAQPLDGAAFGAAVDELLRLYPRAAVFGQLNVLGSHDTPRLLTMASGNRAAVRLAFACLFTLPGAPCLYYGDEVGMAGGHDPDCRRGFDWDEMLWDRELWETIRALIQARRRSPALTRGDWRLLEAQAGAVAYARTHAEETVLVGVNPSATPQSLAVRLATNDGRDPELLLGGGGERSRASLARGAGELTLNLPAGDFGLWRVQSAQLLNLP